MFSELAEPRIGIETSPSQASRQALLSPVVSWPTTSASGPLRSAARTSTAPVSSRPSDPVSGRADLVEHLAVRGGADHGQGEQRARARPHRPGVVGIGSVSGHHQGVGAERVGRAGDGPDVAGSGRPVEDHDQRGVRESRQVVGRLRHDRDQLGRVLALTELGQELGGQDHALCLRECALVRLPEPSGPPGPPRPVVAEQGPDRPAVLDRGRDRPDTLHEELAEPVPLGAVVEQRVPLLEARVARTDPHGPTLTAAGHPIGKSSAALSWALASLLRALVGRRSPNTVPSVWSVSCWRQRASRPSPVNSTGSPVETGARDGREVRARALDERAGVGEAALVALVEVAVLALGQRDHGVADDTDGVLATLVGAVEDEDGEIDAHLTGSQADAVGGVHGRDHVGDEAAQLVVVRRHRLVAAVHDVAAPPGDRPDGAALGQRTMRGEGLVGHARHPRDDERDDGHDPTPVTAGVTPSYSRAHGPDPPDRPRPGSLRAPRSDRGPRGRPQPARAERRARPGRACAGRPSGSSRRSRAAASARW